MTFEEERKQLHKEINELAEEINRLKKSINEELQKTKNKERWSIYLKRKVRKFCMWMDSLSDGNTFIDCILFLSVLSILATAGIIAVALAVYLLQGAILLGFIPFVVWVSYHIYKNVKD